MAVDFILVETESSADGFFVNAGEVPVEEIDGIGVVFEPFQLRMVAVASCISGEDFPGEPAR